MSFQATKNSISENEAFRFANEIKELLDADALSNSRLEISRRFFNFGVRCFKQQSWEPAVRWTKLSLSIPQPQLEVSADASQREARSYRMLALCFKELRLVEQALSSVEKAVLLDEENVDNWFLSIELLAIAQRFHDAEIAVASMTKLSDLTITQAFLICSLLAQFDSELALRCLLLVSIRFPGDESIMLEHFRILLKASRLADALLIVQQRAGMSDRSSLSGDFIALVWDVIASRWVAKSLPECEAWLLAFHFLVSGSKFEAELARAGRALSLLYFETQKYEASLKYALEARLREPSAAASFMALRAQLHLGMVEDALKMFQVLLASPDFDKKLLLSIVIHSNNTACRQILIQAIQAILVHPEFAVDILPLNQMLLSRTAIVSLLDASISDESLPSYAQSDQSSVSDQEKRITLALEFVQLGLIAAVRF
jgi:tetratricopeptide (TPR) repeat protein